MHKCFVQVSCTSLNGNTYRTKYQISGDKLHVLSVLACSPPFFTSSSPLSNRDALPHTSERHIVADVPTFQRACKKPNCILLFPKSLILQGKHVSQSSDSETTKQFRQQQYHSNFARHIEYHLLPW